VRDEKQKVNKKNEKVMNIRGSKGDIFGIQLSSAL